MRLRFLISEAFVNLRRNALMVLGAVLAVFVTILLIFGALVIREVVRLTTVFWEDGVRVLAFVNDDLSDEGVAALIREVEGWDGVDGVRFVSKAEAYEEALEIFEGQDFNRRTIEENPSILPASVRVTPVNVDDYQAIEDRLRAHPAVIRATSPGAGLERMIAIRDFLTQVTLVVVVGLAISAVVLIANTIRLAIYARRQEVGIMKLVGASNWFIRVPFLLEGLIEGLVGGGLAVGLVISMWKLGVKTRLDELPNLIRFDVSDQFLTQWALILLVLGGIVGVLGSGIALRRFLRES
jgi:cell division transport system permease protein